jgi:hypothetical protein
MRENLRKNELGNSLAARRGTRLQREMRNTSIEHDFYVACLKLRTEYAIYSSSFLLSLSFVIPNMPPKNIFIICAADRENVDGEDPKIM